MPLAVQLAGAAAPWTFTCSGKTYTARPVSVQQVAAFKARLRGADEAGSLAAVRDLLRIAFPKRLSHRWRGDPVDQIFALPLAQFTATVADFFDSQGTTLPMTSPRMTPPRTSRH